MKPEDPKPKRDEWFVIRATLWMALPFTVLFVTAFAYGGHKDRWPFLVASVLVTFLLSFGIAFGLWYFLVRPKEDAQERIARQAMDTAKEEPGGAIEYVAHYTESQMRTSERAFVRRGLRELWLWETLVPLAAVGLLLVYAYVWILGSRQWVIIGALGCLMIAQPAFLLIMRPATAAAGARKRPTEVIAFRPEGIVLRANAHERTCAWHRIRGIWDVGPHYVLIGDRHLGIHLPKDGLPAGALDYIRSHASLTR